MRLNVLWRILPGCLIAACTSVEYVQQHLDSYIGKPINLVREEFGYDYHERALTGNRTAYSWRWMEQERYTPYFGSSVFFSSSYKGGGITYSLPLHSSGYIYHRDCEFTFITDSTDIVQSWRAQGDGCRYYRPAPVLRSSRVPVNRPEG